jgi:hypothetical protein
MLSQNFASEPERRMGIPPVEAGGYLFGSGTLLGSGALRD